jgi:hypothetical protein
MPVSLQELKSLTIGVVLVCGVMLAGPLTSHASPADPFAVTPVKVANVGKAKAKPHLSMGERFGAIIGSPKVNQTAFDLTATTARDFGDWDQDVPR